MSPGEKDLYTVGIDFGTLSGRAVLARVCDGRIMAEASLVYPHGIMNRAPSELQDKDLGEDRVAGRSDWALEDPADYLEVLRTCVPELMRESGVSGEDVIGLGLDVTSYTLIPTAEDGRPLSMLSEFRANPHAWCKLWKHHAAQKEADRITELARNRKEDFLEQFGGKISSEWLLPKVLEILHEAPEIYQAADAFMDAPDWLVRMLTGARTANLCSASYKGQWSPEQGYYNRDFLEALEPGLSESLMKKLQGTVLPPGARAGVLNRKGAELTGLPVGIPVAAGNVDAHVSVPGAGITGPGELLMIIGTSTCSMICDEALHSVRGMCGVVKDGILPGLYGYEAGQPCVGDCFGWFTDNMVPRSCYEEAEFEGKGIHTYLTELAARLRPGKSGLLALDWWNGNRSVLNDAGLSGMMVGMTLQTRPEDIYRALLEGTAFGMRKIRDRFAESEVPVRKLYACGGISLKNPLLDQIYADVLGQEIRVSPCLQTPALGSAMFGAVAAGREHGGYSSIAEAASQMADSDYILYKPDPENHRIYNRLYTLYNRLYELYGEQEADIMHSLKEMTALEGAGDENRQQ